MGYGSDCYRAIGRIRFSDSVGLAPFEAGVWDLRNINFFSHNSICASQWRNSPVPHTERWKLWRPGAGCSGFQFSIQLSFRLTNLIQNGQGILARPQETSPVGPWWNWGISNLNFLIKVTRKMKASPLAKLSPGQVLFPNPKGAWNNEKCSVWPQLSLVSN